MATRVRAVTSGSLVLILAVCFGALQGRAQKQTDGSGAGLWKPFLTEAELNKIIDDEVTILKKELDKPKPDDKRIRASALVIALAAQDCKNAADLGQLTLLRDTALQITEAAGKLKMADLKIKADRIAKYKTLKTDPQSDLKPANLKKLVEELGDAMVVFDKTEKGGEGLERDLLILGQQKKPFTPAQMSDKQLILADKAALIAEVARAFDDLGKNQKKDWQKFTDEMRQGGIDLAAAIKAKNNKGMKTAINKLNSACFDCHGKFRDKDK